jgi:hypothetical protein
VDAVTAGEAGRAGRGIPDQDQLDFASAEGRILVTQDLHFQPDLPHGSTVVMQRPLSVGEYVLYLQVLSGDYEPDGLADQGHYYNW